MMLNKDSNNEEEKYLLKYENYGVFKGLLKLMMGNIFDLNNVLFCFFEVELFKYGDKLIDILEVVIKIICFVRELDLEYIKEIQFENNEKSEQFVIRGIDICLYDMFDIMGERYNRNVDVFVIDRQINFIVCLFFLNIVFIVFSINLLKLIGIC